MNGGFGAVQAAAGQQVGFRLFTILAWDDAHGTLHRVHTSHPAEYPTGGQKVFSRDAPWIRRVVVYGQPYLGRDRAAVAAVFADHELIASLGCGAVVNVAVIDSGRTTLGVLNLLDAEGAYDDDSVATALPLAGLAVEPLQRWHAERRTAALDEAGR